MASIAVESAPIKKFLNGWSLRRINIGTGKDNGNQLSVGFIGSFTRFAVLQKGALRSY